MAQFQTVLLAVLFFSVDECSDSQIKTSDKNHGSSMCPGV